jgi:outer membrane receptor protein involved in Fe transport
MFPTLALLWLLCAGGPSQPSIAGIVRDTSGAPIAGASVQVRGNGGATQDTTTDSSGRFGPLAAGNGDTQIIVSAPRFATAQQLVTAPADITIVLRPAAIHETVTVTASRMEQRLRDAPASVQVVTREAIEESPALVADDVLRQVPTFSLFRRTSSIAAHPTTQGVSLRGVGPSGVSRSLVLLDGVPVNDPFGGWVYWSRVPLARIERVEVVEGPSAGQYGNYAMGGVISVISAAPRVSSGEALMQYGSRNTPKLDLSGTVARDRSRVSIDASLFGTDGYPIVSEGERGPIDGDVNTRYVNGALAWRYDFGGASHVIARAGHFREARDNGKISTFDGDEERNSTRSTNVSGVLRLRSAAGREWQVSAFADNVQFRSNFLAVPAATPPRSVGRMTLTQHVPATGGGANVQWSGAVGDRQFLTIGGDWRRVTGESREEVLDSETGTAVVASRVNGGNQHGAGAYVQDVIALTPRVNATLAARFDTWRSSNSSSTYGVLSPRVALLYRVSSRVALWGNVASGFRAPTLNELYRQFRVGNVTTLANAELGPEELSGVDGGARYSGSIVDASVTAFGNRFDDPISNVTIGGSPGNVVQQRQNLGRTRIHGMQLDAEFRPASLIRVRGAYMFARGTIADFPANRALEGNAIPQVPRHRGSVRISYANPRLFTAALSVLVSGRQFDDDQNLRRVPGRDEPGLPGYALVDLHASRRLTSRSEIFAGVQNLFDRTYFVGTLPTTTGTPRTLMIGLRARLWR